MEGIEPGGEGVAPAANTPPSDAGEADPSLGAIAVELAAIDEEMARLAGRKGALEELQWELGLAGPLGPPPPDGEDDASAGAVEAGTPTTEEGRAVFYRLVGEYRGLGRDSAGRSLLRRGWCSGARSESSRRPPTKGWPSSRGLPLAVASIYSKFRSTLCGSSAVWRVGVSRLPARHLGSIRVEV